MGTLIPIQIVTLRGDSLVLQAALCPFFGSRAIEKELGAPLYNDPGKKWFVAFTGGAVVGWCALRSSGATAILCSAYVLPEHRGKRVYERIFKARLAEALALGLPMRATVTDASLGTLRRHGFTEARAKGRYHVMERNDG